MESTTKAKRFSGERVNWILFCGCTVIFTHYLLARLWVASQSFVFLLYAVIRISSLRIVPNLGKSCETCKSTTEVQGISPGYSLAIQARLRVVSIVSNRRFRIAVSSMVS